MSKSFKVPYAHFKAIFQIDNADIYEISDDKDSPFAKEQIAVMNAVMDSLRTDYSNDLNEETKRTFANVRALYTENDGFICIVRYGLLRSAGVEISRIAMSIGHTMASHDGDIVGVFPHFFLHGSICGKNIIPNECCCMEMDPDQLGVNIIPMTHEDQFHRMMSYANDVFLAVTGRFKPVIADYQEWLDCECDNMARSQYSRIIKRTAKSLTFEFMKTELEKTAHTAPPTRATEDLTLQLH